MQLKIQAMQSYHTCRFHIFHNDKDDHPFQLNVYTSHSNNWQILLHNYNKIEQTKKTKYFIIHSPIQIIIILFSIIF